MIAVQRRERFRAAAFLVAAAFVATSAPHPGDAAASATLFARV